MKVEKRLIEDVQKKPCAETWNALLDFWRDKRIRLMAELPCKQ